jgi:DNA-directed RNA polymerase subunit RPC12/RpoP
MYEKVKNACILKKLKAHPELFRSFNPEPRAAREFDFNDDGERFTVIYKSIDGTVFSRHNYRISNYMKHWCFEGDETEDTTTYKFDACKLRKMTEKAVDNRLKAYNESINKCFNDVIKDLSFRVENAAKEGRYSINSGINIYIGKYLDEQDIDKLTIKQRDDWSIIVTKKLDEYFSAKGFNTNILQSNYYTLDWSYKEAKNEYEPNTLTDTYKGKKKVTGILPDIEGDNYTVGIKGCGTLISSNENTLKPVYDEMNLWNEINSNFDYTLGITAGMEKDNIISDTKPINLQVGGKDGIIGDVNPLSKGLFSDIKCPYCGARHFMEKYSISDCVYRPTIYKDGKVISPIKGEGMTTTFECLECGKEFVV